MNMASLDVNKEVKSRLPIPVFTGDTILTFKSTSNKNHRQAKKLLFAAKSLYKKDLPKEKQKEKALNDSCEKEYLANDKFSISEKLTDVYLESARNGEARNGCFIKCNYLEELVVRENLSYFIMKIYPHMIFLYFKNAWKVQFFYHTTIKEEYDLLDSIDNEEIPACIFDEILSCENWHLMYDYHCFLKIQKYSFEDNCALPVFSSFVLLKPTTKLLIDLTSKSPFDTNNNNGSSEEEPKESYESKICFEISGPLYLDIHPTALELINLLKIYHSPFGSTSLKYLLGKRPVSMKKQSIKVNPFKEEVLNMLAEQIPQQSSSRKENVSQLNGSPFSYVDLKESLHSSLVNRNLEIRDALYTSQTTTLVEVFKLITSKKTFTGYKKYLEHNVKYLSVFWKHGQFYAVLTLEKYVYDPSDHNDFIPLYILKVAEILSCRFSKFLSIQLKNVIDNTDKHFFPYILDPKIKEITLKMNDKPWRSSVKSHINGTKRKIRHSIHETDSESDDELEILKKTDLEAERDYKVKCKSKCAQQMEKTPERVPTSDKEDEIKSDVDNTEADLFNSGFRNIFSSNTKSQESTGIQSVKPISESQPFEEGKSVDHDAVSKTSNESIELYPRLTSKFEVSEEDFFRDIDHDHSYDMKKLSKWIQGDEDYL